MAGFHRAGVYPFNPKAIAVPENDSSLSGASPGPSDSLSPQSSGSLSGASHQSSGSLSGASPQSSGSLSGASPQSSGSLSGASPQSSGSLSGASPQSSGSLSGASPQSSGSLSGASPQSSGSLSGASPQSSGSLSGASPQSSGSLSGASPQSSGSLSGASPQSSGSLSGASPQSSGSLSGASPQSSGSLSGASRQLSGRLSGTSGGMSDSSTYRCSPTFTSEQLDRFKIRYEEGYDVYEDSDYVKWLELKAVPADRYSFVSSVEDSQMASGIDSLVDHFSEVNPLGAVADNIASNSSVNNDLSNTPVVSTPCSKVSALSKYLVLSGTSIPSGPKKAPPCARLLTSAEALAILAEKEQKKQKEAVEKEQKKKEREEKKRQREEERKWKAEEKTRKAGKREKEKARQVYASCCVEVCHDVRNSRCSSKIYLCMCSSHLSLWSQCYLC